MIISRAGSARDLDQLRALLLLAVFANGMDRNAAQAGDQVAGQGDGPDMGRIA